VDVIPFRRSAFSVYSFVEGGMDVVRAWFSAEANWEVEWPAFCMFLDIYEAGGFASIAYSTEDLGDGFFGLKIPRRGGTPACPIFVKGPFDEATEITFLLGARWDERQKIVRPYGSVGTARENLEVLLGSPTRRRRRG
jgi:hypothetical protein